MRQTQFPCIVCKLCTNKCFCVTVWLYTCLGGKVAACLELLEEGWHEDGGEEKDHTPEEDIWDVGAMGATGTAHKVPMQLLTLLLTRSYDEEGDAWRMKTVMRGTIEAVAVINVSDELKKNKTRGRLKYLHTPWNIYLDLNQASLFNKRAWECHSPPPLPVPICVWQQENPLPKLNRHAQSACLNPVKSCPHIPNPWLDSSCFSKKSKCQNITIYWLLSELLYQSQEL